MNPNYTEEEKELLAQLEEIAKRNRRANLKFNIAIGMSVVSVAIVIATILLQIAM